MSCTFTRISPLRQTLGKWSNQRYATIPVLKRNGEYMGSITEGISSGR